MIGISQSGDFKNTKRFLDNVSDMSKLSRMANLRSLADQGVAELMRATPVRTGKTSKSWSYDIQETNDKIIINWNNDNIVDYVNIAIILQCGHATRNGGYVQGNDYINPALRPIFDKMATNMWKAVVS